MSSASPMLLLVEDNEDDVFLLRRALAVAGLPVRIHVAGDGQEAVDYLSGSGKYADRGVFPRPILVLLDLKLPFIDGLQALAWVRQHPEVADLPVVVLTSSDEERDRGRAAELGVLGYHVKPPTRQFVTELIAALGGRAIATGDATQSATSSAALPRPPMP